MATLKKKSILDQMFGISSDTAEIQKFFDFFWKVHEATECISPECDIACFIIPLKEALFNSHKEDKTYQKMFFIAQCMKHPADFGSMAKLRENNKSHESPIRDFQAIGEDESKKRREHLLNANK